MNKEKLFTVAPFSKKSIMMDPFMSHIYMYECICVCFNNFARTYALKVCL